MTLNSGRQSNIDTVPPIPCGLIVPVATPFERDLSISKSAYLDHLSWLKEKGVRRVIIGGTTAEFFSLTITERLTLLELARKIFDGLIVFNISADSMASSAEAAKRAQLCGADALLCLPPYYYAGAPQSGLIAYFSTIADSCEAPFYLYNFPRHTGNPLTAEILLKVRHAGLKDSAADLSLIPSTPRYLLGGDACIVEAYRKGARGYVPGLPNVFPEFYLELEKSLDKKDYDLAQSMQSRIKCFKSSLPKVSGIIIIKQYLNRILDCYPVNVRPPLDNSGIQSLKLPEFLC